MDASLEPLFEKAKAVRENAHVPVTGIKVGCALEMENGKTYAGCNVENHIAGVSLCSERVTLGMAASDGARKLKQVLVVSDYPDPWAPCGVCRQAISEFASPDTPIYCTNLEGKIKTYTFSQLFPEFADFLEK